jgi:hypothetical protein
MKMRSRAKQVAAACFGALLAFVGLAFGAGEANAKPAGGTKILYDDFKSGFDVGAPASKWFYFSAGPYVGDGGIVTTDKHGLHVASDAVNFLTGEPAFSNTLGQEHENGGIPGGVDHVKWLAYQNHLSSHGFPGWDLIPGQEFACEAWIDGRTFGTQYQPFGSAVSNPNDDLRLSAFAANSIDFESFMVFDFFVTNETIYAFYERLPFGRGPQLGNYAAFSFQVPVASNHPWERHHLKTAIDKAKGKVRWIVDGEEVFSVDTIGLRIDRSYMTLDHGGTEGIVSPNQLDCGMGLFTLMDAYRPSDIGLVKLSDSPGFYFDPSVGQPTPSPFLDSASLESNRIFGQGAAMDMKKSVVSYTPTKKRHDGDRDHDCDGDD